MSAAAASSELWTLGRTDRRGGSSHSERRANTQESAALTLSKTITFPAPRRKIIKDHSRPESSFIPRSYFLSRLLLHAWFPLISPLSPHLSTLPHLGFCLICSPSPTLCFHLIISADLAHLFGNNGRLCATALPAEHLSVVPVELPLFFCCIF